VLPEPPIRRTQPSEVALPAIERQKLREMNLLDQTRIGYEQKQAYQDWLAQLAAEGYLTSEEYDARMEWLFAAQTEDQIKMAFRDLPRLKPTGMEPANPARRAVTPKPKLRHTVQYAAMWFVVGILCMIASGLGHDTFMFTFDSGLTIIWGVILAVRIMGHDKRR
jgi:Domain of unknown function (DUF1707)